jgi:uncharacterized protein (TIGR02271 family)
MEPSANSLVIGKDGLRGRSVSVPLASAQSCDSVLIRLEDGQEVYVPADLLQRQEDGSYYLNLSADEVRAAQTRGDTSMLQTVLTVPVIAEELSVEKRQVEMGRARITKHVREHEQIVDEPLLRQEVAIEHVPINQAWEGAPPTVRYEGETLIIPLLEEVLVVEKRLMLKEELHISRIQKTVHEPQRVILRSEEVTVERVEPAPEQAQNGVS